ncbi:MAG: hypothetical protein ACK4VN_11570 [Bacteroidales bacterium]
MTQSRMPFGKGWIVLLIWLLWLPETLQGQRRDGELEISGRIEQSYEPVGNGTIRIYEGSRMIRSVTTNSRGRFSFTLPLEGEYIVAFSAPGLVTKRLMFDTSIKDRRTRDRLFQFDFVVDLFPEIDGIDFTFFEEPLSTIAFIDEINRFFFRESETSPRLRRANEIHRQVVDLIRRREAYAQTIVQADQFFRNQSYEQARASYVEANGFLPDETYPVRRIEEIDRILAEQRDQRAQDLARQQEAQREREREQQAEQERQRLQREQQAAANRQQEAERLRQEQERQAELARQQEAERQRQAEQARQQEAERQRLAEQERQRLERERQAELARQQEAERLRQEQERQAELARQQEAERQRQAEQARQQEAERQRLAEQERQRVERERQAELARQQEAERQRQAELARQQEAERQRQAALAQQQTQQRPQTPQPSASSADNQREYNAAIAQGDQLFQRRQFFNARDAYQLALSFRPNESHPSNRIREINQILADSEEMARFYANGFFDVSNVKERILNNSEKRYYFVPFDRRRTGSYLMLQAENLDGRPMRLFINYGKDNERLGGFSINIGGQTGVTDLKIDISGQARWITDNNNWISIYPLGGNIELHNLKIHFGPGQ